MPRRSANETITSARILLRQVIEQGEAADLARMEINRQLLERSVLELRELVDSLQEGSVVAKAEVFPLVTGLKQDIARTMKMIDAGAAFYRGLAVRLGDSAPAYTATGRMPVETSPGSCGLEA